MRGVRADVDRYALHEEFELCVWVKVSHGRPKDACLLERIGEPSNPAENAGHRTYVDEEHIQPAILPDGLLTNRLDRMFLRNIGLYKRDLSKTAIRQDVVTTRHDSMHIPWSWDMPAQRTPADSRNSSSRCPGHKCGARLRISEAFSRVDSVLFTDVPSSANRVIEAQLHRMSAVVKRITVNTHPIPRSDPVPVTIHTLPANRPAFRREAISAQLKTSNSPLINCPLLYIPVVDEG